MAVVLRGYNHDIGYGSLLFHAQTECRTDGSRQHIESTLFLNGAVICFVHNTYGFEDGDDTATRLAGLIKSQHRQILSDLKNGKLDPRILATPGSDGFAGCDGRAPMVREAGLSSPPPLPPPRQRRQAAPRGSARLARGSRTVHRVANTISSADASGPTVLASAPRPSERATTEPDPPAMPVTPTAVPPPIPQDETDRVLTVPNPAPTPEPPHKTAADHFARGMIALRKGAYEEARREWEAAARLDAGNPTYKANLALVENFISAPPRARKGIAGDVA